MPPPRVNSSQIDDTSKTDDNLLPAICLIQSKLGFVCEENTTLSWSLSLL